MSSHWDVNESPDIFLILNGDGLKQGEIPVDHLVNVSHMDVYPSVIEYLGLEFAADWDLDGRSRIEWTSSPEPCDLSNAKPVISVTGGYMFTTLD